MTVREKIVEVVKKELPCFTPKAGYWEVSSLSSVINKWIKICVCNIEKCIDYKEMKENKIIIQYNADVYKVSAKGAKDIAKYMLDNNLC